MSMKYVALLTVNEPSVQIVAFDEKESHNFGSFLGHSDYVLKNTD